VFDFTIEIDTRAVNDGLRSLPDKIARNVLRRGVFDPAKFIRDRVRIAAPTRRETPAAKYYGKAWDSRIRYPGFLKRTIGAKYNAKRSNKFDVRYNVRPLGYAFYGFFVEGGHRIGKRPGKAKSRLGMDRRGHVPPHPFMAPVFKNAANEALERMKTVMLQGIYKEWAATGFKGFARQ
jgi:hypothetical protein